MSERMAQSKLQESDEADMAGKQVEENWEVRDVQFDIPETGSTSQGHRL